MISEKIIENIPQKPGVYIMKDEFNKIIYIGKAAELKERIRSYFHNSSYNWKISSLMSSVKNIEYIVTNSEYEALILESSLIKKYKPKYNIIFKDDKTYPLLKLTINEEYPRLVITRVVLPDGAKYYGPYVKGSLRKMIRKIFKLYPVRDCNLSLNKVYLRPCIKEQIGTCSAPCIKKISKEEYRKIVNALEKFLDGQQIELAKEIYNKMKQCAKNLDYESAAKYRDMYEMINLLSLQSEKKIKLSKYEKEERKKKTVNVGLQELKKILNLEKEPTIIEAFDISNLAGDIPVGSCVVFENGEPKKDEYRHFNIKEVQGRIDDYAMLKEIVRRRYKRILNEKLRIPDLIVIDGGIGHLSKAEEVLKELNISSPIIAIEKNENKIFTQNSKKPIRLSSCSFALHLLQHIRDEAHRFAISHHRRKRKMNKSILDEIKGIGKVRKEMLLTYFKDIKKISNASIEELEKVPKMTKDAARKVYEYFFKLNEKNIQNN